MSMSQQIPPGFEVEIRGRENDGRRFPLGEDGLLVGRSESCDVSFNSREVSRRHAYFYPDGRACYVEDLGAVNGVLVNGKRVKKSPLHDGDIVGIGPNRFIVHALDTRGLLARWLLPGVKEEPGPEGADEAPEVLAGQTHEPLALAALVFGVFAYLHWVFGVCGVLLVLLSWRETRGESFPLQRPLLLGALLVALMGAGLNAWFEELTPRRQDDRAAQARLECMQNLVRIRQALRTYAENHGGRHPNRLEELCNEGLIEQDELKCPGGGAHYGYRPAGAGGGLNGYTPVVYDAASNHRGQGGWVLLSGGRIEWLDAARLEELLRAHPADTDHP